MDSNTFTAFIAISSTLLGVTIGGVVQYYLSKRVDERKLKHEREKQLELDHKRKVAAYRRLHSFTERIKWKRFAPTEGPARLVSKDELEGIESTITQNHDVLDTSTITAWDKKFITQAVYNPELTVSVSFDEFLTDVEKHYKEYAPKPPTS